MSTTTEQHLIDGMTLGEPRTEIINGRPLQVRERDMRDLPNLAREVNGLAIVSGPRGAQGWLYTRRNGTRWILWIPSGRMGQPRKEEILETTSARPQG